MRPSALSIEEREFERIMDAIKGIRNARAEKNVPPSRKAAVYVATDYQDLFAGCKPFFEKLASASDLQVGSEWMIDGAVQVITNDARIFLPMEDLIDKEKELERLNREKASCEKDIKMLSGKLSNEKFVSKGPANIVEQEREKLSRAEERMAKILESLQALS